jgi:hypothetical protein
LNAVASSSRCCAFLNWLPYKFYRENTVLAAVLEQPGMEYRCEVLCFGDYAEYFHMSEKINLLD